MPPKGFDDKFYEVSIANGTFKYQINKVEEADFDSFWLFSFYNGHFAGNLILSAKNSN